MRHNPVCGASLAFVTLAVLACGNDASTAPITNVTPPATPPRGISTAQYMDSSLSLMQSFSINQSISWATFRATWNAAAAGAQTYAQTYPFIQSALSRLDPHSSISPPSNLPGSTDAPPDRTDKQVQGFTLGSRVGYLWVPGFIGKNQLGRVDSTHAALRKLETSNTCGWIVDLRANNGGFFFALMASVGPLYAPVDATVGGQQYNGDYRILWYYKRRGATDVWGVRDTRDSAEMVVANPWRPNRPGLPVAVLHSTSRNSDGQFTSITASAGESITLAFRGGPPTRSFGLATYGIASSRSFFIMPDSARIDITSAYMFDRRGYTPRDNPIPADTSIASPSPLRIGDANDPVIAAALAWVNARPECTAGAVPSASRVLQPTPDARGQGRLPSPRSVYEERLNDRAPHSTSARARRTGGARVLFGVLSFRDRS